jgi:serine/threonine protein phosphatase PrpC
MVAHRAKRDMVYYNQVEVDDKSLFVGIYDGRGGKNAAKFFSNILLQKLLREFLFSITYVNHLRLY